MRPWLLLILVVGCTRAEHRETISGAAIASDTARSSTGLSCNHCHATRVDLDAQRISPAPPWPGTLQRAIDVDASMQHCATERQHRPLTAPELVALRAFLDGECPALPAQPTAYPRAPFTADDVTAAAALDPDGLRGEQLYKHACIQCHATGPGTPLDVMRSMARIEVIEKVLTSSGTQNEPMPAFVRGQFALQDAADVAAFAGGQQ